MVRAPATLWAVSARSALTAHDGAWAKAGRDVRFWRRGLRGVVALAFLVGASPLDVGGAERLVRMAALPKSLLADMTEQQQLDVAKELSMKVAA